MTRIRSIRRCCRCSSGSGRALPRFQQTRGVLRLLALWVSHAYVEGFKGAHKDPLITLGTAPLEDPTFRAAVFEQLGESRLEAAVTTDIVGRDHAHALRLDKEATPEVKNARLHRKVATSIFFESNGGQQRGEATLPEIRLAVAEPGLDVGNVEQCVESLTDTCYFLAAEKNRYRFSFQPNLNKLLADGRASVQSAAIRTRVRSEIEKVFGAGKGVERVLFPEKTGQVPDRPILTLVVLAPENRCGRIWDASADADDGQGARHVVAHLQERAAVVRCRGRFCPNRGGEGRSLPGRRSRSEADALKLDEPQRRQLDENLRRAKRDLQESVWRAYKNVFLLDEKNELRKIDLGLVHSSAADSDGVAHPGATSAGGPRRRRRELRTSSCATGHRRCRSGARSPCATRSSRRRSSRAS